MQAGIRAMLKQLGKSLKQRERVAVESILGAAQVGVTIGERQEWYGLRKMKALNKRKQDPKTI